MAVAMRGAAVDSEVLTHRGYPSAVARDGCGQLLVDDAPDDDADVDELLDADELLLESEDPLEESVELLEPEVLDEPGVEELEADRESVR